MCRDIFLDRWNPDWEKLVVDRGRPLRERLIAFYWAYAAAILTYEGVRLFMFARLRQLDLNGRGFVPVTIEAATLMHSTQPGVFPPSSLPRGLVMKLTSKNHSG